MSKMSFGAIETHASHARMGPYGDAELDNSDQRGARVFLGFRILINNISQTLAHHVGAVKVTGSLVPLSAQKAPNPLKLETFTIPNNQVKWPSFDIIPSLYFRAKNLFFMMFWVGIHANNIDAIRWWFSGTVGVSTQMSLCPGRRRRGSMEVCGGKKGCSSLEWAIQADC